MRGFDVATEAQTSGPCDLRGVGCNMAGPAPTPTPSAPAPESSCSPRQPVLPPDVSLSPSTPLLVVAVRGAMGEGGRGR